MSIVVVATVTPKPDKLDALKEAFATATPQIQKEPGCLQYATYSDGTVLVTIERWEDDAALAAHLKAPAIATLLKHADELLGAAPEIRTLHELGFGDVVKD